jgi:hypothetical protein
MVDDCVMPVSDAGKCFGYLGVFQGSLSPLSPVPVVFFLLYGILTPLWDYWIGWNLFRVNWLSVFRIGLNSIPTLQLLWQLGSSQ